VEMRIKKKVEDAGIALKNWDVKINYGIKTGLNDAFIINAEKRNELIEKCPEADDIIRPILRGRDVQKYKMNWADLYIINTHNGYTNSQEELVAPINIIDYPAVKDYLDTHWPKISIRQDMGVTPYNLRSCVYTEDFSKQKIVYPNMTKFLPFYYDTSGFYTNQKCFIITGEHIAFLTAFLNSSIFKFCFKDNFPELLGGTRELSKVFFDKISIIKVTPQQNEIFESKILQIQKIKKEENRNALHLEKEIDNLIFDLYDLTEEERAIIGFIEIS
jgi:hypothetical protein